MLNNPGQLLERNLEHFEGKRLLVINCEDDQTTKLLQQHAAIVDVFVLNYQVYQYQTKLLSEQLVHFGPNFECEQPYDAVLIYYPKAKPLADYLITIAQANTKTEGLIFLVGDNKGGIKSSAKRLKESNIFPQKLDSARHCSLFCWGNQQTGPALNTDAQLTSYQLEELTIKALPGVFSQSGLDIGSQLLLENIPPKFKGKVLDFGCGAGVIGCNLKQRYPNIRLSMLDVSALAVTSSQATAQANSLEADIFASDGLSEVEGYFDWIVSNPPFHTGVKTDYSISEQFFAQATKKLSRNGKLLIVANGFLKYQPILEKHYFRVSVVAKTTKFVVYLAEK